WITHGHFSLGQGWLDAALAETTDESPALAYGLLSMARLRFWQGDYPGAHAACERSLDLYREQDDDSGRGLALTLMGSIHGYEGDYEMARERLEEVLSTVSDAGIRMEALVAIGEMFLQTGDLTHARA